MLEFGEMWAVWIIGAMLLIGAALIVASLRHTSERFWYWKQARQMVEGEVAPAVDILRMDQQVHVLSITDTDAQAGSQLSEAADRGMEYGITTRAAMNGRIVGIERGRLRLRLEPKTLTRAEEQAWGNYSPVYVGQTLNLQITGSSALFRFSTLALCVASDPEHPFCTHVEVELPAWLARIQRRQHVRALIHSKVTLQAAEENGTVHNATKILCGTLRDLSGGGLCLELDSPQSPDTIARLCEQWGDGALLECRLSLPHLRETPLCLSVRSCERIVARGGLSLRLRGKFAQIPIEQQQTLISLVFQAQRRQLAPI